MGKQEIKLPEKKIIKLHKKGGSIYQLSKVFKVSVTPIRRVLISNLISTKRDPKLYSKDSRIYKLNEGYFEKINNQDKAYILGFIYADGNLHKRRPMMLFEVTDLEIVEKIRMKFGYNGPIYTYHKKNEKQSTSYRIAISSLKMYGDLLKLGLHPNKSLTIKFPNLKKSLRRHFIRGYFDGDGCISVTSFIYKSVDKKNPKPDKIYNHAEFSIVGNKIFLTELNSVLSKEAETECSISKTNNMYRIRTCDRKKIQRIFKYLYIGANVKLERKYEKFKQVNNW